MTQSEIDSLHSFDGLLAAINLKGLNASIVEPDGTAHGWMTTTRNVTSSGIESLWFGLTPHGNQFKFDVSADQCFDFFDGDQLMYRFKTMEEITAFVRGILWVVSNS